MNLTIKRPTLRASLNKTFRQPQRTEVTKLTTKIITARSVFKNKQIIEVVGSFEGRFESPI